MGKFATLLILMSLLSSACGPTATPTPTSTPTPTMTPAPTSTPEALVSAELPAIAVDNVANLTTVGVFEDFKHVNVSADGTMMLLIGTLRQDFRVVLVDLESGTETEAGEVRNGYMRSAISPNNQYVAYVPADPESLGVRVWDVEAGATSFDFFPERLGDAVFAFSPDSNLLGLSVKDRILIDVNTGEALDDGFEDGKGTSRVAAFLPDGNYFITEAGSSSSSQIEFSSVETYEITKRWDMRIEAEGTTSVPLIWAVDVSADGQLVAVGANIPSGRGPTTVQIWRTDSDEALQVIEIDTPIESEEDFPFIHDIDFNPDSSLLAVAVEHGKNTGFFQVYDVESGEKLFESEAGREVNTLAFGAGGRILAVATTFATSGTVTLYGLAP